MHDSLSKISPWLKISVSAMSEEVLSNATISKMALLSMSSPSSVDKAPAQGGHGFDSCRGLIFFSLSTLVSLLIISSLTCNLLSWKSTITFIYHNSWWHRHHDIIITWKYAVCLSHENSVKWPCSPWVVLAQSIKLLPGIWEVMG